MALRREQIYLVGGAVRDQLLGLEVKDHDWVVVGATPEEMLAEGFLPVGKDFPVFIKPDTGEEYALARTERKSGIGYKGFTFHTSPDVTLEQDLIRRDLTINAMARSSSGELIDPYNGQSDLQARRLQHVSPAFREDPLRVLRVARFAARFEPQGFEIADPTLQLMREISQSGELSALTAERVWQEFERALSTPNAPRFLEVLSQAAALQLLLPEFTPFEADRLLPLTSDKLNSAEERFATLFFITSDMQNLSTEQLTDRLAALCERLRIPNRFRDLTRNLLNHYTTLTNYASATPETRLSLITELKLQKSPDRLMQLLPMAELLGDCHFPLNSVKQEIDAIDQIQPKTLIQQGFKGAELGAELRRRQIEALSA